VISLREVAVLDRNAEALGVPTGTLMANAGRAVAEEATRLGAKRVLVLAGPGNNGGDGLVAARHLARTRGVRVSVALAARRGELRTRLVRDALRALPSPVKVVEQPDAARLRALLEGCDLVIDALLGAGLRGELREPFRGWVLAVNASGARVLSVDVPTGLGTDLALEPEVTVTLHDAKEGMDAGSCGRIVVADIGIPPRAATHTGPGEMSLYPIPPPDQHKGQGGVVLVVGGGPYAGAPALAGMAALRAGANLAIVLTPERVADTVQRFSPNLIVQPLHGEDVELPHPDNLSVLEQFLPRTTAAVVGNGVGRSEQAMRSVRWLIERFERQGLPVVVDADGLHALARQNPKLRREVLLTPHAGEFEAVTGEPLVAEARLEERAAQAKAWASRLGCTLVAKGHASVITDGQRVKFNSTGNPGMSAGGTGDVLAGVAGALLAKGLDPFDAARLAAWMCGRAGDLAFEEQRFGLVATDVLDALPSVFREAGLHWRR
jgi:NAD(P)H-hydrate epimerase